MLNAKEAYRLGSMPGRVYRQRCHTAWPDEQRITGLTDLLDEWRALLRAAGHRRLRTDLDRLDEQVRAEQRAHLARQRQELRAKRSRMLVGLGQEPLPPIPSDKAPDVHPDGQPDSLTLLRELLDGLEPEIMLQQFPGHLQDPWRLGDAVSRCLMDPNTEDTPALTIWETLTRWGKQEWITHRPAGTPLGPGETIPHLVVNRIKGLDEMLLDVFPEVPPLANSCHDTSDLDDPYLNIEQVARMLKIGTDTVERLINSKQLAVVEISGKGRSAGRKFKRVRRESLETFMKSNEILSEVSIPVRKRRKQVVEKDYFPDV